MVTDQISSMDIKYVSGHMYVRMYTILWCVYSYLPLCAAPPLTFADPHAILEAVKALQKAKRPLIIIGKGSVAFYRRQ